MKWAFRSLVLLCFLACRDPNSYQPFDPTKPDPPGPPVLTSPANGWLSKDFAYPQKVDFAWQPVPGAQFYEMQCNTDSLFPIAYPGPHIYQTSLAESVQSYGLYYWRVRAAGSNWNNYTDWSVPFHFALPNPGR